MTKQELEICFKCPTFNNKKSWAKLCFEKEHDNTKQLLEKYKEDVEQVELFGMERNDYEEKKSACAELIVKLREIEQKLNALKEIQDEKSLFELVCVGKKFEEMKMFDGEPTERQYVEYRYNESDLNIVKEHYLLDKEVVKEERPEEKAGFIIVETEEIEEKRIIVRYEYQPKPIIHTERPEEKEGYYLVLDYIEQETQIVEEWRYEEIQIPEEPETNNETPFEVDEFISE